MKITVEYDNKKKSITLEDKAIVKDLLNKLNIKLNTVIVVRNDNVILEDETIEDKDTITILSAVSGG